MNPVPKITIQWLMVRACAKREHVPDQKRIENRSKRLIVCLAEFPAQSLPNRIQHQGFLSTHRLFWGKIRVCIGRGKGCSSSSAFLIHPPSQLTIAVPALEAVPFGDCARFAPALPSILTDIYERRPPCSVQEIGCEKTGLLHT
jgi:hypothetical protein